jgi:hypothetical protein
VVVVYGKGLDFVFGKEDDSQNGRLVDVDVVMSVELK